MRALQFSQILGEDEQTRDRCFKFLGAKLKQLGKETITDEVEAFIVEQLKKISQVIGQIILSITDWALMEIFMRFDL